MRHGSTDSWWEPVHEEQRQRFESSGERTGLPRLRRAARRTVETLIVLTFCSALASAQTTISSWSETTSFPAVPRIQSAVAYGDHIVVVSIGGTWVGDVNPSNGSVTIWRDTLAPPAGHRAASYPNVAALVGRWLVLPSDEESLVAELAPDGSILAWTSAPGLPISRFSSGTGAAAVWGDRIFVAGGHGDDVHTALDIVVSASVDSSGTLSSWNVVSSMPHILHDAMATVIGDRLFVFGGEGTSPSAALENSKKVISAAIDTAGNLGSWVLEGTMLMNRPHATSFVAGDTLHVIAGGAHSYMTASVESALISGAGLGSGFVPSAPLPEIMNENTAVKVGPWGFVFGGYNQPFGAANTDRVFVTQLEPLPPPDDDGDGIGNGTDNCPLDPNPGQADADADGLGDACDDFPADPDNDSDGDLVGGDIDNCPAVSNSDQLDADGDGAGDVCDSDDDNDGIGDGADNCPLVDNYDQVDTDDDGEGDACDADDDNDTVLDPTDNCPLDVNGDQLDSDGDSVGDVCDLDDDNDTVEDHVDNCPFTVNSDQADLDGDGLGDPCDADADGDGVAAGDSCPLVPNSLQEDLDSDGEGDACDVDDDGDLVDDDVDNCPLVINPGQADLDGDGIGDGCDVDVDGDGVDNGVDNCLLNANPGQDDADGDGLGDSCDPDDDGDGVADGSDNCSLVFNTDQADFDSDGLGDVCDADLDGDGVDAVVDNCALVPNPTQLDFDGDGAGDACDVDIDGDGVDEGADLCAFTPLGSMIDPSNGCSVDQLVPCSGPRGTTDAWKNHGKYVSALTKTAKTFVDLGLIAQQEKDDIVSAGAESDCGQ